MSLVDVETNLGNQRIGHRELSQREACESELAEAHDPNAELGDRDHATSKLTDRDDAACHDRESIGTVLEGDMKQRQSQDRGAGLVLEPPPVPFLSSRIRGTTLRTGQRVLGNL